MPVWVPASFCLSASCWRICSKILGACCHSLEASAHFPFAKQVAILDRYFWFDLVKISVAAYRSSNSSLRGIARLRAGAGGGPPGGAPAARGGGGGGAAGGW